MSCVAKYKEFTHLSPFLFAQSPKTQPVASNSIASNSFSSTVVKMSGILLSVRYRYIHAAAASETLMKLFPFEFRVGSFRLCSKYSVSSENVPYLGMTFDHPSRVLKFNLQIDNLNCVTNDEMIMCVVQSVVKELEVVEEIVSKLRMKRTLEKYEVSMLFYMLLQKVGSNGVIDA